MMKLIQGRKKTKPKIDSIDWFQYRTGRIAASHCKRIPSLKSTTSPTKALKVWVIKSPFNSCYEGGLGKGGCNWTGTNKIHETEWTFWYKSWKGWICHSLRSSRFLSFSRWRSNKRAKKRASEGARLGWAKNWGEVWRGWARRGGGGEKRNRLQSIPNINFFTELRSPTNGG